MRALHWSGVVVLVVVFFGNCSRRRSQMKNVQGGTSMLWVHFTFEAYIGIRYSNENSARHICDDLSLNTP